MPFSVHLLSKNQMKQKQKYKRLPTMAKYLAIQTTLVNEGKLTKIEAFDNLDNYSTFLKQQSNLDLFIGDKAIFKGFSTKTIWLDGNCHRAIHGNKDFDFWKQEDGSFICTHYPTIGCLIKYDVDVVEGLF